MGGSEQVHLSTYPKHMKSSSGSSLAIQFGDALVESSRTPLERAETQRLKTPDYFGPTWTSRSPTRPQGTTSPGPQYLSDHARSQIRPGANNSFNTNGSPIRGIRQTNNSHSPSAEHARLPRGPSQDRNITSPLEHARVQRDFSNYATDDRTHQRRGVSQERSEHRVMSPSENSGMVQQDFSEHPGEDRTKRRRAPSQRAMLSQALQQANHAVVLDNAQNFEGAMRAYHDACDLLQQVILRSAGGDDRKKLEAIV